MRMLNLANNMQVQGSGGLVRLPGADFQTLFAGYDGSLPAGQSYSRLSNAWNSETGLIAPHNLILWSEDISQVAWTKGGGSTNTGTNQLNIAALATSGMYQFKTGWNVGDIVRCTYNLSGSGDVRIGFLNNGGSAVGLSAISLTASPTAYSVEYTVLIAGQMAALIQNALDAQVKTVTVTSIQMENVTSQPGISSGYVKTTTQAYYAPRYQTGRQGQGILIESASTNKCSAFSVPPVGTYATTQTAGQVMRQGGVYEIVARTTLDFGTVGTLLSGTANTTGAQYLITSAIATLGVSDQAKQDIGALGTKAYHNGTAFVVPFVNTSGTAVMGINASSDTSFTIEIVDHTSELTAALTNPLLTDKTAVVAALANGGRVYKTTSAGALLGLISILGTAGVVAVHDLSVVAMGDGAIRQYTAATAPISFDTGNYSRKSWNGSVAAGQTVGIQVNANSTVHFIGPQLEESPYATSQILCQGVSTTRAAGAVSGTSAGVIAATSSTLQLWFKPTAVSTGKTQTLWSSYTDASNWTSLYSNGVIFYIEKRKAGVSEYVTVPIAAVGGSWYLCSIIFNADGTMGLMVNGTADGKTSGAFPTGLGAELYTGGITGWTPSTATIDSSTQFTNTAATGSVYKSVGTPFKIYNWLLNGSATAGTLMIWDGNSSSQFGSLATPKTALMPISAFLGIRNSAGGIGAVSSSLSLSQVEVHNNTTATVPVIAATYKVGAFADTATGTLQADGLIDNGRYFGRVLTLDEHQVYYARGK